ncbi:MAG: class I SAM-dependent methyltransferase [Acidobacteriota bacterium]|nr:class I SAM-dependent methyltransferase [Acidobacteriota bacterium]
MPCPSCRRADLSPFLSREAIAAELALRERFFAERIDGYVPPPQRKDRTDIGHGDAAEIVACDGCGILIRLDDCVDWRSDPYAPYVMEQMLRSNIDAFSRKEVTYRPILPGGAKVVEVGSYVGGFLHVATAWGWDAIGVDVGEETSQFARAHGYVTRTATLEACAFGEASFDAVFIWNCFEQIGDPAALLTESRRILKPEGTLVIRTPNAFFYTACAARLHAPEREGIDDHGPIVIALGHANLLGFPHLYGFSATSLDRFVSPAGFTRVKHVSDRHIPPSISRLTVAAKREHDRMDATLAEIERMIALVDREAIVGPWFEGIYRRKALSS